MDSGKLATKRDSSCTVNSFQNQDQTLSDNEDQDMTKRRKLEENPLQIPNIVEKIFSFLDGNTIKKVRTVSELWSAEGAKILLTKCYVHLPKDLGALESSSIIKETSREDFTAFLSYKSSEKMMISNIAIDDVGDVELWDSLRALGPQVNSVKLNFFDYWAKSLHKLLNLLPNLKYLNFDKIDCYCWSKKVHIFKTLTSVMSQPERDQKPLVIPSIKLQSTSYKELKEIENLSECTNIGFEELDFATRRQIYFLPLYLPLAEYDTKFITVLTKILSTSQDTLKILFLGYCETYLSFLELPCMTKLTTLNLVFGPQGHGILHNYRFSPSFKFAEKFPNLAHISIEFTGTARGQGINFFGNLLEHTGPAPSVKSLELSDNFFQCTIDPIFQVFPNLEDLRVVKTGFSQKMFGTIWKYGKHLKRLSFSVYLNRLVGQIGDLDSFFTGFSLDTVDMMKNQPALTSDTYEDEDLEKLRISPSILDLKDLKELVISFYGDVQTAMPKQILAIAGEFAFRFMPRDSRILIEVEDCEPMAECVIAALDEVSKLSNVIIERRLSEAFYPEKFKGC